MDCSGWSGIGSEQGYSSRQHDNTTHYSVLVRCFPARSSVVVLSCCRDGSGQRVGPVHPVVLLRASDVPVQLDPAARQLEFGEIGVVGTEMGEGGVETPGSFIL